MLQRNIRRGLSLLCLIISVGGCTTIRSGDVGRVRTYVGVVRVVTPNVVGDVTAIDVKSLGIGWDQGPFLGWKAANHISADPSKCQLLIVARSRAQMQNAENILNLLKGQNTCVANFSERQ